MANLRHFLRRVVSLFGSGRSEHELNRAIESHLALLEEEFVAQGM